MKTLILVLVTLAVTAVAIPQASATYINLSQYQVSLNTGSTAAVTISSDVSNNFYIAANSNTSVVTAGIVNNTLTLYGVNAGTSSVSICTVNNLACTNVAVAVTRPITPQPTIGGIALSQYNLNLNAGQSASVTVSYGGAYQNNFYVSGNTNPNVASASISGQNLTVTGISSGTTTISVSAITGSFGTANLYVTVSGYNYNNLYFVNASPTQGYYNQYYNYQFKAAGGSGNYTYSLYSGNLPYGLYLASNGMLYGTPNTAGTYTFNVRASDTFNGSNYVVSNPITMYIIWGTISGNYTYAHGTLVNDNGTIYIMYKNMKSGFATWGAFVNSGYRIENVVNGPTGACVNSGYVINTSNGAHPWGTWIKNGQTVYFVHETGLVPIATYDVFINNGGQDRMLVPANIYDFQKPVLPMMTYNDSRLD